MLDLSVIADFSREVSKYNRDNIEIDVSVFNGLLTLTIEEWSTVSHRRVYATHIPCESHEQACLIASALNAYINQRA